MRLRPAPTYENGLAIPPRKRDCVGEQCPVRARVGRCFIDRHHLYYSQELYYSSGQLYQSLRDDPTTSEWIARCRHNSAYPNAWHAQYDYTPLPPKDIVHRFLEESSLMTLLGVTVADMAKDLRLLDIKKVTLRERVRLEDAGVLEKRVARFQQHQLYYQELLSQTVEVEVVPPVLLGRTLTELGARRNELLQRAQEIGVLVGS